MNQIIKSVLTIALITIAVIVGAGTYLFFAGGVKAKDFKNAMIAEIENSNFNSSVIAECQEKASDNDYELSVTVYNENDESESFTSETDTTNTYMAELVMTYKLKIPLSGKEVEATTRGVAR